MAIVVGTSAGFLSSAPSGDPDGGNNRQLDDYSFAQADTSPAGSETVTEIGFYCSTKTSSAPTWYVGIYDESGGSPNNLLAGDSSDTLPNQTGWISITGLNISISASTAYFIAIGCETATFDPYLDMETTGGDSAFSFANNLEDPWDGYDLDDIYPIYAVWTGAAPEPPFTSINIGDEWKSISGSAVIKINIGDVWKNVSGAQINISDAWKAVTLT